MNSCWIHTTLSSTDLEFREIPIPAPKPGEVILKTHATSLNRGELLPGNPASKIGGGDAAGTVHQLGEGVIQFEVGDKVFGRVTGGWAEYSTARADQLMPLGDRFTWPQAAAIGITYLAAYELLYPPYGKLQKGETLLIAGASSGVGVAALQIAKAAFGATVIGTSGSAEKLSHLKTLGLDHAIHTRQPDFADQVKTLTDGQGANLAINLIGGSVFPELLNSLARKGRLGIAGYVDGILDAKIDLALIHRNRLEIFGISNAKLTPDERADAMARFTRDILPLLHDGHIIPVIDKVFPFNQLSEAKAYLESNAQLGKVIIEIG